MKCLILQWQGFVISGLMDLYAYIVVDKEFDFTLALQIPHRPVGNIALNGFVRMHCQGQGKGT